MKPEITETAKRPVHCPWCAQVNLRAHDDGYTEEAPRAYHAGCWRAMPRRYQLAALAKAEQEVTA